MKRCLGVRGRDRRECRLSVWGDRQVVCEVRRELLLEDVFHVLDLSVGRFHEGATYSLFHFVGKYGSFLGVADVF